MFRWLRRKSELAMVRAVDEDISRFLSMLKGASDEELGLLVALATHNRHTFEKHGSDLLRPRDAEMKDPLVGWKLNRIIKDQQATSPAKRPAGWSGSIRFERRTRLRSGLRAG